MLRLLADRHRDLTDTALRRSASALSAPGSSDLRWMQHRGGPTQGGLVWIRRYRADRDTFPYALVRRRHLIGASDLAPERAIGRQLRPSAVMLRRPSTDAVQCSRCLDLPLFGACATARPDRRVRGLTPVQDFAFFDGGWWAKKSRIRSAALMSWVVWPSMGASMLPGQV